MTKTKQTTTVAEAQAVVIEAEKSLKRAQLRLDLARAEYMRIWHATWDGKQQGADGGPVAGGQG